MKKTVVQRSNLPKVSEQVNDKASIQTQAVKGFMLQTPTLILTPARYLLLHRNLSKQQQLYLFSSLCEIRTGNGRDSSSAPWCLWFSWDDTKWCDRGSVFETSILLLRVSPWGYPKLLSHSMVICSSKRKHSNRQELTKRLLASDILTGQSKSYKPSPESTRRCGSPGDTKGQGRYKGGVSNRSWLRLSAYFSILFIRKCFL